ncbi:MAG: hypothetical protein VW683_00170 [Betaproteobacteria bacterium]|jgi:chromosome segregation ATPase
MEFVQDILFNRDFLAIIAAASTAGISVLWERFKRKRDNEDRTFRRRKTDDNIQITGQAIQMAGDTVSEFKSIISDLRRDYEKLDRRYSRLEEKYDKLEISEDELDLELDEYKKRYYIQKQRNEMLELELQSLRDKVDSIKSFCIKCPENGENE